MEKEKVQNYVLFITSVVISCFMIIHFSIILLHVIPKNPINLETRHKIDSYVQPFFSQNWHLFAPDPLSRDNEVHIRVRHEKDGQIEVSDWINATKPFIENNKKNIISPTNRMARITTGLIVQMNPDDEFYRRYKNTTDNKNKDTLGIVEEIMNENEEKSSRLGNEILHRYACSIAGLYYEQEDLREVQVRLVFKDVVPYSERKNPKYTSESESITLGWNKYIKVIPAL